MASLVIATFLSLATPYLQAEAASGAAHAVITSSTDDSGRKVYVNESFPVTNSKRSAGSHAEFVGLLERDGTSLESGAFR